jgi:hypothetical protein
MNESNVKVNVALRDSELDEEELEEVTQNLFREMRQLDEVDRVDRVLDPNPPEGNKALGGFLVGILTAEVNAKNIKAVLRFLGDRLGGKLIELEVEANGKKLKVKAHSQQELKAAIEEAEKFIAAD